jgi:hypothetical protein
VFNDKINVLDPVIRFTTKLGRLKTTGIRQNDKERQNKGKVLDVTCAQREHYRQVT